MLAWRQAQQKFFFESGNDMSPETAAAAVEHSHDDRSIQKGLKSLQEMMLKQQKHFEKRHSSEYDMDRDVKLPKLSPIENNTCSSVSPLSLCEMSTFTSTAAASGLKMNSNLYPSLMSANLKHNNNSSRQPCGDKSMDIFLSHREKAQNQQYLDRLRRMNERSQNTKERGSRVNFDQYSSAKTVREELASRKGQPGNRSSEYLRFLEIRFSILLSAITITREYRHFPFHSSWTLETHSPTANSRSIEKWWKATMLIVINREFDRKFQL